MPNYEQLAKVRNPEHNGEYWEKLRSLYAGGQRMGLDKSPAGIDKLKKLIPQQYGEEPEVYQQRLKRACYLNYFGQLVDYIVAAMASSPIEFKYEAPGASEEKRKVKKELAKPVPGKSKAKPTTASLQEYQVDPFYSDFFQDVTPPSARKMSFNQLMRSTLLNALVCKDSWTLLELPSRDPENAPKSLADEEKMGLRNVYACVLDPEQVVDWECDDYGELEWAMIRSVSTKRVSLDEKRDTVVELYTRYDREGWEKFSFTYKIVDGEPQFPNDAKEATKEGQGKHSFGKVPLVRFCLPEGLWAGNKIANLAEAHLNKRSAFDWGQLRGMFQFLAAELTEPNPLNPVTEDAKRGVNQKIGPGRIWIGGKGDKLYNVAPDAEPFRVALEDMASLRDEIMRIMHHMALSQDNSGSALKRSGDSKKQDAAATKVVLKGLGEEMCEYAEELIEMCARGRKEYGKFEVEAQGADEFEDITLDSFVEEMAAVFTQISPKSAHFVKRYSLKGYKLLLGSDLTDEDVEIMRDELDENVTNEALLTPGMPEDDPNAVPGEDKPTASDKKPADKKPAKKSAKE